MAISGINHIQEFYKNESDFLRLFSDALIRSGSISGACEHLGVTRRWYYNQINKDDQLARELLNIVKHARKTNHILPSPRRRGRRAKPGRKHIYLIRESAYGYYKIGVATDLDARFAALDSSCPQTLRIVASAEVDNVYTKETGLHAEYIDKLIKGEWFSLDERDVATIITHFKTWEEKTSIQPAML